MFLLDDYETESSAEESCTETMEDDDSDGSSMDHHPTKRSQQYKEEKSSIATSKRKRGAPQKGGTVAKSKKVTGTLKAAPIKKPITRKKKGMEMVQVDVSTTKQRKPKIPELECKLGHDYSLKLTYYEPLDTYSTSFVLDRKNKGQEFRPWCPAHLIDEVIDAFQKTRSHLQKYKYI